MDTPLTLTGTSSLLILLPAGFWPRLLLWPPFRPFSTFPERISHSWMYSNSTSGTACSALVICCALEGQINHNLQEVKSWFMCRYAELTEAAEQNKDYKPAAPELEFISTHTRGTWIYSCYFHNLVSKYNVCKVKLRCLFVIN